MRPRSKWSDRLTIVLNTAAVAWLLLALEALSDTGMSVLQLLAIFYGVPVFLLLWAVNLIVFFLRSRPPRVRRLLVVCIPPIAVALVQLLSNFGWSLLKWRVALSASALEKTGGETWDRPRLVGLFVVYEKRRIGSELRFTTAACHILDDCGIVFAPETPPQPIGEDSFYPLGG
ncbi:MAG: hypothetical protein ACREKH_16625, partial [Candidatus Rokuibacteriota bacterium]